MIDISTYILESIENKKIKKVDEEIDPKDVENTDNDDDEDNEDEDEEVDESLKLVNYCGEVAKIVTESNDGIVIEFLDGFQRETTLQDVTEASKEDKEEWEKEVDKSEKEDEKDLEDGKSKSKDEKESDEMDKEDCSDDDLEVKKITESIGDIVISPISKEISRLTGLRGLSIQNFIEDNDLNDVNLLNYVAKGKTPARMDLTTAIVGKPDNKIQQDLIKKFKK